MSLLFLLISHVTCHWGFEQLHLISHPMSKYLPKLIFMTFLIIFLNIAVSRFGSTQKNPRCLFPIGSQGLWCFRGSTAPVEVSWKNPYQVLPVARRLAPCFQCSAGWTPWRTWDHLSSILFFLSMKEFILYTKVELLLMLRRLFCLGAQVCVGNRVGKHSSVSRRQACIVVSCSEGVQ